MTPETLRAFAPRARADYLEILSRQGNEVLTRFGINRTRRRFCHFMAQVAHECGSFTIVEESGAYSATGIMRIFGVGRHSAGVTQAEAQRIAALPVQQRGEVLFERVYGPARSPRKARDLGNTQVGDGYRYRGRGFLQITGRAAYREMGRRIGLDLENKPELAGEPLGALMTAAAFWDSRKLNTFADQNNIELITKRINGGHNGLADRRAKLAKAMEIWDGSASDRGATRSAGERGGVGVLEYGDLGPDVLEVKRQLAVLGYDGFVMDEDFSKGTHLAVASWQIDRGLAGNGIVDAEARQMLDAEAREAGYVPGAATRSRTTAPDASEAGGETMEAPASGRRPGVIFWGALLLLFALAMLGLKLMEMPDLARLRYWRDWVELGFPALVVIGGLALVVLGASRSRSRVSGSPEDRASAQPVRPDEGLPREADAP
jgi:predicted chitinase